MDLSKTVDLECLTKRAEGVYNKQPATHESKHFAADKGVIEGNSIKIRFEINRASDRLKPTYEKSPLELTMDYTSRFAQTVIGKVKVEFAATGVPVIYNYFGSYGKNRFDLHVTPGGSTKTRGSIQVLKEVISSGNVPELDPTNDMATFGQAFVYQPTDPSAFE